MKAVTAGPSRSERTLHVEIDGGGLRATVVSAQGRPLSERVRAAIPRPATPRAVCAALRGLLPPRESFDRVSVGFPGVVVAGVVQGAPGLHRSWNGFDLATWMLRAGGRPTRVVDEAGLWGLGVVQGRGTEICLGLGTGLGFALFVDGRLVPNVEMGRHPFRKGKSYEELLCGRALAKRGAKRWNRSLAHALRRLDETFHRRAIHLGGGNAREIALPLPRNVKRVESGAAGPAGAVRLWGPAAGPVR